MYLSHKCEQGIMANSHLIFLPLSRGGGGLTAYNCVTNLSEHNPSLLYITTIIYSPAIFWRKNVTVE